MRMIERGEDLALARDALPPGRRGRGPCGSFSATLRCISRRRARPATPSPMPPTPISRISRYGPIASPASCVVERRQADARRSPVTEVRHVRSSLGSPRRRAPAACAAVSADRHARRRQAGQPGCALLRRQIERLVEQGADARPGLGVVPQGGLSMRTLSRHERRRQQQLGLVPVAPHRALGDAQRLRRSRLRSGRRSSASRPPAPGGGRPRASSSSASCTRRIVVGRRGCGSAERSGRASRCRRRRRGARRCRSRAKSTITERIIAAA